MSAINWCRILKSADEAISQRRISRHFRRPGTRFSSRTLKKVSRWCEHTWMRLPGKLAKFHKQKMNRILTYSWRFRIYQTEKFHANAKSKGSDLGVIPVLRKPYHLLILILTPWLNAFDFHNPPGLGPISMCFFAGLVVWTTGIWIRIILRTWKSRKTINW